MKSLWSYGIIHRLVLLPTHFTLFLLLSSLKPQGLLSSSQSCLPAFYYRAFAQANLSLKVLFGPPLDLILFMELTLYHAYDLRSMVPSLGKVFLNFKSSFVMYSLRLTFFFYRAPFFFFFWYIHSIDDFVKIIMILPTEYVLWKQKTLLFAYNCIPSA